MRLGLLVGSLEVFLYLDLFKIVIERFKNVIRVKFGLYRCQRPFFVFLRCHQIHPQTKLDVAP